MCMYTYSNGNISGLEKSADCEKIRKKMKGANNLVYESCTFSEIAFLFFIFNTNIIFFL